MVASIRIPGPSRYAQGAHTFAPAPDLYDEANTVSFFFGWADLGGGWRIERQNRADASSTYASAGHPSLADAWEQRLTLDYA